MGQIVQLNIKQGETYRLMLTLLSADKTTPLNIENYSFSGIVKENYTTETVVAIPSITKIPPYTAGTVLVELTSEQTSLLTQRKYMIDLEYTVPGIVSETKPLLEGYLVVRRSALY